MLKLLEQIRLGLFISITNPINITMQKRPPLEIVIFHYHLRSTHFPILYLHEGLHCISNQEIKQ